MKVVVIAVGKIKERGLRELIDDYEKRIGRYAKFEEVELVDGPDVEPKIVRAIPERARNAFVRVRTTVMRQLAGLPTAGGPLTVSMRSTAVRE